MKIVLCGPPHSGKSVFIANLIDKLPTDDYTIIRACPDGEGTWSNNKNQNQTSVVRKKGKFTKEFIDNACTAIDNQTNKIVIVDVGGVMSKENEQVFKHCDSFIVLSSDEQKKQEWLQFGEKLGLECIGCIDSSLEGHEEIYSKVPYFQGKIVGLERGEVLENSTVIMNMVSDIIKKSKYEEKESKNNQSSEEVLIDDTELGFKLGYGKEIITEDETTIIKKVKWTEEAIPKVYNDISNTISRNKSVRINGVRANFILSAICNACKNIDIKDISTYDIRMKKYIPIRNMPKKTGIKQTEGLTFNIIENKDNIFMDIDIMQEQYSLDNYEKCILPKIKENKSLYLSGRMPLWLLASISTSYNSDRIFTFQPGKGFTCISSIDERDLGTIVDGINGIDLNSYFSDKRNLSEKTKYPIAIQKQGILSKLKNVLNSLRSISRKSKYLDNSIVATKIVQDMPISDSNKGRFIKQTEQQVRNKGIYKEKISSKSNKENEMLSKG